MKFKSITLSLAALSMCALTTLTSCGGAKAGEKEIEASSIEVVSDSADWVSVADGKYKLVGSVENKDCVLSMNVKLVLTKELKIENPEVGNFSDWKLTLKDKNGTDICELKLDDNSLVKVKKLVSSGSVDDEIEVTFKAGGFDLSEDEYKKALSDAESFSINGANYKIATDEPDYSSSYSSSSSDDVDEEATDEEDESETASSGDTDWDEVLDSYDAYVTKYIAIMKKASSGDPTAIAEYAGLMQEAQELGDKLSSAQGELTNAQWARYTKILTRLTNAAKTK